MEPYHPFHRQFQVRRESRSRMGWCALLLAVAALGLGQWFGSDNTDDAAPYRPVAEGKSALRAGTSLSERAGQEMRSSRPPSATTAITRQRDEGDSAPPAAAAEPTGHDILNADYFRTALQGLRAHGADLNQPMPSRHLVATRSLVLAQRMVHWGRQQGYHVEPMETPVTENGEAIYLVPLVKVTVPQAGNILADAQRIAAFASAQGDMAYRAWEGAIVRRP